MLFAKILVPCNVPKARFPRTYVTYYFKPPILIPKSSDRKRVESIENFFKYIQNFVAILKITCIM